ncbi:IS1182 family transposase, partial [bacterium]
MDKDRDNQGTYMYVNLDEYVPPDHILRAIRDNIDFSFIYDKVKHLYSDKGRPSDDPVKLIKMLLIGYIFGIPSERQIEEQIKLNLAYRWFLNLDLADRVPDHSTISQNRRRRFRDSNIFQELFDEVVRLCISEGLVTGKVVVTDSTHVKASASNQRKEIIEVKCTPSEYMLELDREAERLQDEINQEKGYQGKKRGKKRELKEETREVVVSTTDPDSGYMNRPNKPKGFHYLNHMSIDTENGIITDVHVTPGNVNDHEPYIDRLKVQEEKFGLDIQKVGADKGYDYMNVHYGLDKMGIEGYIPQFERSPKKQGFSLDKYLYD